MLRLNYRRLYVCASSDWLQHHVQHGVRQSVRLETFKCFGRDIKWWNNITITWLFAHCKGGTSWMRNLDWSTLDIGKSWNEAWFYSKVTVSSSCAITSGVVIGPRSAVVNVSGYRCVSDCRSRGREFDPGPVPYFRGDWPWNNFSSLPLIHSRRVVVSYKRKYVHKLMVNRLFKPVQEKVWLGELTVPQWP